MKEEEDPTQIAVEIVHGNFYQPANDPNADWDAEVSPQDMQITWNLVLLKTVDSIAG